MLVVMAQSGDRAAGERLATRWYPRLLRSARRYVGVSEDAEALAQDCWMAIARGLVGLSDPSRFAPWAFGILRKLGASRVRALVRERVYVEPNAVPDDASPARQEDRVAIAQAFERLPADQRFAAHLFFIEGLTLSEIAQACSIPIGTAKSRLFHARRQLKEALSPQTESHQGENP